MSHHVCKITRAGVATRSIARVRICAVVQQQAHSLWTALPRGHVQGRVARGGRAELAEDSEAERREERGDGMREEKEARRVRVWTARERESGRAGRRTIGRACESLNVSVPLYECVHL